MRKATVTRKTKETDIYLELVLEGKGQGKIDTGCAFLNHMLELFSSHARFDLSVNCKGDKEVDYHHSVEDIGIALGEAFKACLGDKKGIARYGAVTIPMDEALAFVAVDISGRAHLSFDVPFAAAKVGDFDTELTEEFFEGFARFAAVTIHVKSLAGKNTHHVIEAVFKAFARSLRAAVSPDAAYLNEVPSTKGLL
ncbi:MAG: imidazoleglycerol-phosphate dehydratase HisB [Clostridiaceae bacterium]|jgi:imidazoleglycerol-phosphate dehydratase|nr:imidazoleglycerol-phosphate dehydratase HisB [Clostridiaceae bacterium]